MTPQCIYSMSAVLAYQMLDVIEKPISYIYFKFIIDVEEKLFLAGEGGVNLACLV